MTRVSRLVRGPMRHFELDLPWLDDAVRAKRPLRLPVVLTREEARRAAAAQRVSSPGTLLGVARGPLG